jgi:hypothetical protein
LGTRLLLAGCGRGRAGEFEGRAWDADREVVGAGGDFLAELFGGGGVSPFEFARGQNAASVAIVAVAVVDAV